MTGHGCGCGHSEEFFGRHGVPSGYLKAHGSTEIEISIRARGISLYILKFLCETSYHASEARSYHARFRKE